MPATLTDEQLEALRSRLHNLQDTGPGWGDTEAALEILETVQKETETELARLWKEFKERAADPDPDLRLRPIEEWIPEDGRVLLYDASYSRPVVGYGYADSYTSLRYFLPLPDPDKLWVDEPKTKKETE